LIDHCSTLTGILPSAPQKCPFYDRLPPKLPRVPTVACHVMINGCSLISEPGWTKPIREDPDYQDRSAVTEWMNTSSSTGDYLFTK
jgi:hypothetical protein